MQKLVGRYLKIADLGFAKRLPPGQKTNTLCGTPEYLAPELVTQAGHTRAVDWYACSISASLCMCLPCTQLQA